MSQSLIAQRYDTQEPVKIQLDQSQVLDISPISDSQTSENALWISPGWVDLQVNGASGNDFTSLVITVDQVEAICRQMLLYGVTRYLPTITTQSCVSVLHGMQTISAACRGSQLAQQTIAGIHLEGPYLSAIDGPRGAHPVEHCKAPDWDEFSQFQQAAEGRIKIITISPEYDSAVLFTEKAVSSGVIVSIGHAAATGEQIRAVVEAGASMSTHLGNGAHGQLRRHPNYLWDQLADDRLSAGLIADGHHLPAEVLKVFTRAKGKQRIFLVSDITSMAGMPVGQYDTSLGSVEVLEDGRLVVAGQRQFLAGAALPIDRGIVNLVKYAGLSIKESIDTASIIPGNLIGEKNEFEHLNASASYTLFQINDDVSQMPQQIKVAGTILNGHLSLID